MGKIETYEKLDDFIFAVKDRSIKKIFFKFIPNAQKLALQDNTGKEAIGYKHTLSAFLSAITDDGKYYITFESLLAELIQNPNTKDTEILAFQNNASNIMKKDIIEVLQKDYGNADIKAGSCSPTVS